MPNVLIRGGVEVEIPNAKEIRHSLAEELDARQRHEVRGKKRIELMLPVSPATATAFIGGTGQGMGVGPEEGYVWSLKLVGVNLSATSTLNIYKASSTGDTRRPLTATLVTATVQAATWSADQARLRHGEGIYLVSTTTITGVYLAAWQVPAELEAEIYD